MTCLWRPITNISKNAKYRPIQYRRYDQYKSICRGLVLLCARDVLCSCRSDGVRTNAHTRSHSLSEWLSNVSLAPPVTSTLPLFYLPLALCRLAPLAHPSLLVCPLHLVFPSSACFFIICTYCKVQTQMRDHCGSFNHWPWFSEMNSNVTTRLDENVKHREWQMWALSSKHLLCFSVNGRKSPFRTCTAL